MLSDELWSACGYVRKYAAIVLRRPMRWACYLSTVQEGQHETRLQRHAQVQLSTRGNWRRRWKRPRYLMNPTASRPCVRATTYRSSLQSCQSTLCRARGKAGSNIHCNWLSCCPVSKYPFMVFLSSSLLVRLSAATTCPQSLAPLELGERLVRCRL